MPVNPCCLSFSLVAELDPTMKVKSPFNQHIGQLLYLDIPASSPEAKVREEARHTSTYIPKAGNTGQPQRAGGSDAEQKKYNSQDGGLE